MTARKFSGINKKVFGIIVEKLSQERKERFGLAELYVKSGQRDLGFVFVP